MSNLTENELNVLTNAAELDLELGHALFHLFGEQRIGNLLAVASVDRSEVTFFAYPDEAVDFYSDIVDEGDKPDIFKIPVFFGSWDKYEPVKAEG